MSINRGDEVLVDGKWYPVSGCVLSVHKGKWSGSVFTLKPRGRFEPCLGYRIDYSEIEDRRRPRP